MTTLTTAHPAGSLAVTTGLGSAASAAALAVAFAHTWAELLVIVPVIAAVALGSFGYLVPRAVRSGRPGATSLVLSLLGMLLIAPAFWSGLPLVLGAAGMVAGHAGRRGAGSRTSIGGLVLGALAVLGCLASFITDVMGGGGPTLF